MGEYLWGVMFPHNFFRVADLTKPIKADRKYDLAISLEVAEHLNESCADIFIHNICSHSDIVMFSAAIPLMGGTHHVNEQWPSYWIEKFKNEGYKPLDCLRPVFWENSNVNACYRQDVLIYVKEDIYENIYNLFIDELTCHIFDIVHPSKYFEAKAVDKIINRAWLMDNLPEEVFNFIKKYIFFLVEKIRWFKNETRFRGHCASLLDRSD